MNSEEKSLFLLQADQTCHPMYYYYYYIKFAHSLPPEVKPLPPLLNMRSAPQPVTEVNVCRPAFSTAVLRTLSAAMGHCKVNWLLSAHPETHPKESWAWLCLIRKHIYTERAHLQKYLIEVGTSAQAICVVLTLVKIMNKTCLPLRSFLLLLPFLPSFLPSFLLSFPLSLSLCRSTWNSSKLKWFIAFFCV